LQQKGAGKGGTVYICQAVPSVPWGYRQLCQPLHARASTQVRAVTVQHGPPAEEQDGAAPDIWGIKQDQEKKTSFVSLIAMPLAGARRHHNIQLL